MSRPAVLFGGPSPEHDISILTGLQAAHALQAAGRDPVAVYWAKNGEFHLVSAKLEAKDFLTGIPPKAERIELVAGVGFVTEGGRFAKRSTVELAAVLNACHGGPGEDGSLQAALDLAGVRYSGPSAAGAALGMDKLAFAGVVQSAGLATLPRHALSAGGPAPDFTGPYIVKPRFGGSSIGIEVTDDLDTARALLRTSPHLRAGAIVEPYRPEAIDLNVSVRVHPQVQLTPIERPLRGPGGRIYTYAEKYLGGGDGLSSAPRELPASVPDAVAKQITDAAVAIATLAVVRGAPRIDFLWAGEDVYVNEINTIPGALAWYLWQAAGVSLPTLLGDLLDEAARTPARHYPTDGADGTALRAAGSIASKLA